MFAYIRDCSSNMIRCIVAPLLLFLLIGTTAYATSQCNQWKANEPALTTYRASAQAALDDLIAWCDLNQGKSSFGCGTTLSGTCGANQIGNVCTYTGSLQLFPDFPVYVSLIKATSTDTASGSTQTGDGTFGISTGPVGCQFFLATPPPPKSESGQCNSIGRSLVGHPINPANGAVIDTEGDCKAPSLSEPLQFNRFYGSTDSAATNLGPSWHGSFSRRIMPITFVPTIRSYMSGSPDNSSLFTDEATTCTTGFAQIQSRIPNWAGATTQYVDGICQLIKNALVIGSIPIYSNSGLPAPFRTAIAYDATRDDGQVVHFTIQGDALAAPPSTTLKLQVTGSGYTIIDASDNVETYDSNGVLQSITSRSGVVQTLSYDGSQRLSSVTDNFGHRLNLGYDPQSRLTTVTRQ